MESRCRLCAESSTDKISVLETPDLSSRILNLFQIRISNEDRLPTTICQKCYKSVETTWVFNDLIQKAQEILNELANTVETAKALDETSEQQIVNDAAGDLSFDDPSSDLKCEFEDDDLFLPTNNVAPVEKPAKTEKKVFISYSIN